MEKFKTLFPEESFLSKTFGQNVFIQGAKIGLKIHVKKTKSLRLGISKGEKVTLGNKKIDLVGSFAYLGCTISKDIGSNEDVKSRIAKAQDVFSQLTNSFKMARVHNCTNRGGKIISFKD